MYARKDTAINYTTDCLLSNFEKELLDPSSREHKVYISQSRLNFHRDSEAHEVLSGVVLQHPLSLDLDGGVGGEDGKLHLVDELLAHLDRAVASAEVLTCVQWAAIEWQLDTGGHNPNNLHTT